MSDLSNENLLDAFSEAIEDTMLDEMAYYGHRILEIMSSTEPDWQPIETAPKDEIVLLWSPDVGVSVLGYYMRTYTSMDKHTHWAPRPKGPTS